MDQERCFKYLINGEMPEEFQRQYDEKFIRAIPGDHLIVLYFACKCLRFIEVKVRVSGPFFEDRGIVAPGVKRETSWSYIFPETQIGCGALIVDHEWERRKLPVFQMSLGYNHGFFDHAFREHARVLASQSKRVPLVNIQ